MTSRHLFHLALVAAPLTFGACDGGGDDATDDTDTDVEETDETDTEEPSTASVRVIHASANAPTVSVWSGGEAIAAAVGYGDASGFVDVPAGTFIVDLCEPNVAACDEPAGSVELEVEAGATYSVIALGDFEGSGEDGFGLLLSEHGFGTAEAGEALVRVIHASPDAPTVGIDVGIDDPESPEFPSFPPLGDSGAAGLAFPAGVSVRLGITPEDGGDVLTSFTAPALGEGEEWYVIAAGFAADKSYWDTGFTLLAVNQDSESVFIRQDPRLVVLHASQDAPIVDVFAGDAQVIADLAYGGTASLRVAPGAYDLDLFGADSMSDARPAGDPAFAVEGLELEAGQEYLAVASGYFATGDVRSLADLGTLFDVFVYPLAFSPDDLDDAQVVLAHHSPDTPAVDVGPYDSTDCTIDAVVEDLDYAGGSEVLVLPEGTYDLGAAVAGSSEAEVIFNDIGLEVGQQIVAVVHGYSYLGPVLASVPSVSMQVTAIDTSGVLSMPWTAGAVFATFPTCVVIAAAP